MMRLPLAVLLAAQLLVLAPPAAAQAPGSAQVFVQAPHDVVLYLGDNDVTFRVVARLQCTPGLAGPGPLQAVVLSGAVGPDDGNGSAWRFTQASWNLTWTDAGSGNFSINELVTATVEADGYGARGHFGEIAIGTVAARDASADRCTAGGYTVPARSGHAHVSVGPRPAPAKETGGSNDAPGPLLPVTILLLALAALARRR